VDLIDNTKGNYRFLTGIAPYSSGVVACEGFEIVHVTLKEPMPYRRGFECIDKLLKTRNRSRYALCGMELRSPKPFTFEGFNEFNQGYQNILSDWDLFVDGENPIARTNIAPEVCPPKEPALYAFSYTEPCIDANRSPSFVIAGAGELAGAKLTPEDIVRAGETSIDAIEEKAACVMKIMQARLSGLAAKWGDVTAIDIYTVHPLKPILVETILNALGEAAAHGIRWHFGRPPIEGLEFEMDIRGIYRDVWI
jgi:hypothetical protein